LRPFGLCYIDTVKAPSPVLEPELLKRLERLAIHWRSSFRGLLGGHNVSRYAGTGLEFLDHRRFHSGDDVKAVNWRAYLRLERLFLKLFRTEPRTPVRLFLDTSESMACGGLRGAAAEAKFPFACRLAAALCYIGLVRLETIIVHPFSTALGETCRVEGGRHRFAPVAAFLESLESGGASDFRRAARQFLAGRPTRGLAVFLSDFLDHEGAAEALGHFADHGHELLCVHLAGPEDHDPHGQGEVELVDAETGEVRRVLLDARLRDEYRRRYAAHCLELESAAQRRRGRYVHLTTDLPLANALHDGLMRSNALRLN